MSVSGALRLDAAVSKLAPRRTHSSQSHVLAQRALPHQMRGRLPTPRGDTRFTRPPWSGSPRAPRSAARLQQDSRTSVGRSRDNATHKQTNKHGSGWVGPERTQSDTAVSRAFPDAQWPGWPGRGVLTVQNSSEVRFCNGSLSKRPTGGGGGSSRLPRARWHLIP